MGPRAGLQTFQVFHPFFIFLSDFLKLDFEIPPGRFTKYIISVSSHGFVNWINKSIFPRSRGQMLNCNATHQILRVFSPAENKIQLFGIQKLNIFCIVLCVWVKDNFLMSAFVWQENIFFLRRLLSSWMQMFSRANIATTSLTFPQVPKTNTQRSEILHIIIEV